MLGRPLAPILGMYLARVTLESRVLETSDTIRPLLVWLVHRSSDRLQSSMGWKRSIFNGTFPVLQRRGLQRSDVPSWSLKDGHSGEQGSSRRNLLSFTHGRSHLVIEAPSGGRRQPGVSPTCRRPPSLHSPLGADAAAASRGVLREASLAAAVVPGAACSGSSSSASVCLRRRDARSRTPLMRGGVLLALARRLPQDGRRDSSVPTLERISFAARAGSISSFWCRLPYGFARGHRNARIRGQRRSVLLP